jgi:hypothetical protein
MIRKRPVLAEAGVADFSDKIMLKIKTARSDPRFEQIEIQEARSAHIPFMVGSAAIQGGKT